jgi:hypothetical protein
MGVCRTPLGSQSRARRPASPQSNAEWLPVPRGSPEGTATTDSANICLAIAQLADLAQIVKRELRNVRYPYSPIEDYLAGVSLESTLVTAWTP